MQNYCKPDIKNQNRHLCDAPEKNLGECWFRNGIPGECLDRKIGTGTPMCMSLKASATPYGANASTASQSTTNLKSYCKTLWGLHICDVQETSQRKCGGAGDQASCPHRSLHRIGRYVCSSKPAQAAGYGNVVKPLGIMEAISTSKTSPAQNTVAKKIAMAQERNKKWGDDIPKRKPALAKKDPCAQILEYSRDSCMYPSMPLPQIKTPRN